MMRRHPSVSQKENSHQNPTILALWPDFQLSPASALVCRCRRAPFWMYFPIHPVYKLYYLNCDGRWPGFQLLPASALVYSCRRTPFWMYFPIHPVYKLYYLNFDGLWSFTIQWVFEIKHLKTKKRDALEPNEKVTSTANPYSHKPQFTIGPKC